MTSPAESNRQQTRSAPPLELTLAVGLISAAGLGLEILFMRLLSLVLWHHYAAMIISLALLGIGVSGMVLRLSRTWWRERFSLLFASAAALFGLTVPLAFALARKVAFNPLEVMWDPWQWVRLSAMYLLLAVPFFCAGACLAAALGCGRFAVSRVYRADLIGAGVGSVVVILLLFLLSPQSGLRVAAVTGFAAAALVAVRAWGRPAALVLALFGLAYGLLFPAPWIEPHPSPYKALSRTMLIPGTEVTRIRHSPQGTLTVVDSHTTPLRHAPGLSPVCPVEPPAQQGVFLDGNFVGALPAGAQPGQDTYLDCLPEALPFALLSDPRVLDTGLGGAGDPFMALELGAGLLHIIEANRPVADLLRARDADLSTGDPVTVQATTIRGFLGQRGLPAYDLIRHREGSGSGAIGEREVAADFGSTVEAYHRLYSRLAPNGLLTVSLALEHPPVALLKTMATVLTVLKDRGVERPERRLALVRSLNTVLLLVKESPFEPSERNLIERFCLERSFALDLLPAVEGAAARTSPDRLGREVGSLLNSGTTTFVAEYPWNIAPATDNAPFFSRFFTWESLPLLWPRLTSGGAALVQWPYLIQWGTLLLAVLAGLLLVTLPLLFSGKTDWSWTGKSRATVYFVALGLGFLFLEIVYIQQLTLLLGHPVYALSLVLAGFLVFAGLGSGVSPKLTPAQVFAAVLTLILGAWILLPAYVQFLMGMSLPGRTAGALLAVGPLAFFLGMPFPLGLARLEREAPGWVAWAFGTNGCASVVSPVLATLLSMHAGMDTVLLLAALLYGAAYSCLPGRR